MNTFLFALNAIMPIVLLIALGYIFKRTGLFSEEFLNKGNSFSFRVLIPAMLFCNIYDLEDLGEINVKAVIFSVGAIIFTFLLGCAIVIPYTKDNGERGALVQSSFRSNNAVIGVPLSTSLFGAQGAAAASVLSAFTIPLFNVLAVVTLTIFDKDNKNKKINVKKLLLGIITNPLIISVLLGLLVLGVRALFVRAGISFRLKDITFLYDALKKIALCGTPFPLIILGGKFEFNAVSKRIKSILYGVFMRIIL
ncbi:MAG: AEC family transporter, partial [Clostridiales bacterium]|nr:AEC family transporter [Clostridiales bacterium]